MQPLSDLADAARAVNVAVRLTPAPSVRADRAVALLREAATLLEPEAAPGPHSQVGYALVNPYESTLEPQEFFPYSPAIGPLNPIAPPVSIRVEDDKRVTGTMTLTEPYCGPPWNLTHGGVIALVFDELLGVAGIVGAGGGFTGRLTIHYRRPTPILVPIELAAWVDRVEGRKLIAHGEMRVDGEVTAEAEGLFIQRVGPLADHADAPVRSEDPGDEQT